MIRRGDFRVKQWNPLLETLDFEHRGFHHMRHTYATLTLGAGVPVHLVSRVLGQSQPSITLDIYSHVIPSQQSQATEAVRRLFGWNQLEQFDRFNILELELSEMSARNKLTGHRMALKGRALGRKTLRELTTIVTPDTILRWHANWWHKSGITVASANIRRQNTRLRTVLRPTSGSRIASLEFLKSKLSKNLMLS